MFLSSMRILENHAEQIFVLFSLYDHLTAVMLDNVLHAFCSKSVTSCILLGRNRHMVTVIDQTSLLRIHNLHQKDSFFVLYLHRYPAFMYV